MAVQIYIHKITKSIDQTSIP